MSLIGNIPFRWMTITVELDGSQPRATCGTRSVDFTLDARASQSELERTFRSLITAFPRSRIVTPPVIFHFAGTERVAEQLGPELIDRLCSAAISAGASGARVWPPSPGEVRRQMAAVVCIYTCLGLALWGIWHVLSA